MKHRFRDARFFVNVVWIWWEYCNCVVSVYLGDWNLIWQGWHAQILLQTPLCSICLTFVIVSFCHINSGPRQRAWMPRNQFEKALIDFLVVRLLPFSLDVNSRIWRTCCQPKEPFLTIPTIILQHLGDCFLKGGGTDLTNLHTHL